jgi:hypothetical protein
MSGSVRMGGGFLENRRICKQPNAERFPRAKPNNAIMQMPQNDSAIKVLKALLSMHQKEKIEGVSPQSSHTMAMTAIVL